MLTFDTSTQSLEISDTIRTESWQQCQAISTPGRWQAYLNQICLQTILPWLQEKFDSQPVVTSLGNPEFWELVNGSAITVGNTRLILLPTEAIDRSELRVPQEWVDMPAWVGDYYFAVEVDTDEQVLHVWGYSTHEQIKTQGNYDESDRTYSLTENDFIQDITVFWVMQQVSSETTRVDIPELPDLSATHAEILIQQLSHSETILPRLSIPFSQWGALLQHDRWLQRLCEQRHRFVEPLVDVSETQGAVRLSQWLQNQFETAWQAIADLFTSEPDLAFSFRREEKAQTSIRRVKQVQLGAGLPDVLLVLTLESEPDGRIRIGVQVLPVQGNAYLPANLQLMMLSTTGEVLQSVEASNQSNYIQLRRVKCSAGMAFRLQITVADVSVTEDFVV